MAKRIVRWLLSADNKVLQVGNIPEEGAEFEAEQSFDLTKLFPNIAELPDVQRQLIIFGTKQKLMDTGADAKTAEDKIAAAEKKWDELIAGKWTGERTNATGASENKKLANGLKEASKVVSLEGLLAKKLMAQSSGKPEDFTPEDQKKLDEFIRVAAKAQVRK